MDSLPRMSGLFSKRNIFSLFKVIHRDLAARNVLIGEEETCKVTDVGTAKDVQEDNIYEKKIRMTLRKDNVLVSIGLCG